MYTFVITVTYTCNLGFQWGVHFPGILSWLSCILALLTLFALIFGHLLYLGRWRAQGSKTRRKQPSRWHWTFYTQSALESTYNRASNLRAWTFFPGLHRLNGASMDPTWNNYNNLLVTILRCLMESLKEYWEFVHSVSWVPNEWVFKHVLACREVISFIKYHFSLGISLHS